MRIAVIAIALAACAAEGGGVYRVHGTAADHGRVLFDEHVASPSPGNPFSCATCHPGPDADDRIYPGGPLGGATTRTTFWGGARIDLLESINDCRLSFMDARTPWTKDDEDARDMFAWLEAQPGPPTPIAFTAVVSAPDLPPGDPARGRSAFDRACSKCHGAIHTGKGRLASFAPILPDEVNAAHAALAPVDRRLAFLRKIREGAFISTAGSMPPFSREALSDDDVAAVLAYLGQ
jgi:thiosulfate dehydrogenase